MPTVSDQQIMVDQTLLCDCRPVRPSSAGRVPNRSAWDSPNWNHSRVDLAVAAHGPSPPHTPAHHYPSQSSHMGAPRDAAESPHHAVGVQRHPKGQQSPHRTASGKHAVHALLTCGRRCVAALFESNSRHGHTVLWSYARPWSTVLGKVFFTGTPLVYPRPPSSTMPWHD